MRTILISLMLVAAGLLALPAWGQTTSDSTALSPSSSAPEIYTAEVVARYPHDTTAFTQGLLWQDGHLYESTGQVGQSQIRRVDLATGKVLDSADLPADQFGEGMAVWKKSLVSLTWRNRVIHRWKRSKLTHQDSRPFPFEGWGLTSDDTSLIASDGTAKLRFLNPETYAVEREVPVTLNGDPLPRLNELELIDGLVYANVWFAPYIVGIDPADGVVKRIVDLRPIVAENRLSDGNAVLNGIAYDADNKRIFITGKLWPTLYEIRLITQN